MKCLVGDDKGATPTSTMCDDGIFCVHHVLTGGNDGTDGTFMKCAKEKMAFTKDTCETTQHGSDIKCYCMADNCNHKCTKPTKAQCKVKPGAPAKAEDATSLCAADLCECDATCMAKTMNGNKTTMTMKTMSPKMVSKMKTMESNAPPATTATTKKTKVSNGMETTSKSSTTNAAAFHVVIGMVIIITNHFLN